MELIPINIDTIIKEFYISKNINFSKYYCRELKPFEILYNNNWGNDCFNKFSNNAINKSNKRINNIIKRIINDVSKNIYLNKKYQVKSHIEYKQIKKFVETLNIKDYEFLWCHGDEKMNKLDYILPGDWDCCYDCSSHMKFINSKTFVIYCCFYKKN
jgi:hypothetical protein